MGKKIILIGLDGATFNLIRPWIKDKKLPFFKKMIEHGVHGKLMLNFNTCDLKGV